MLELDEFYCKDEKVPKIDLETFAKDHNKEKEGIKFEADMNALSKELENLDEGKYHPIDNMMGSPASQLLQASQKANLILARQNLFSIMNYKVKVRPL